MTQTGGFVFLIAWTLFLLLLAALAVPIARPGHPSDTEPGAVSRSRSRSRSRAGTRAGAASDQADDQADDSGTIPP